MTGRLSRGYDEKLVRRLYREVDTSLQQFASSRITPIAAGFQPVEVEAVLTDYVTRRSKHFVGLLYLIAYSALMDQKGDSERLSFSRLGPVATTLEIRHAAILLHDDVVDRDDKRGSLQTAHSQFGKVFGGEAAGAALFAGDALFALSHVPLLEADLDSGLITELINNLARFTCQTSLGQVEQLLVDTVLELDRISTEQVLETYCKHMAATTVECSLVLAGVTASLNPRQIEGLRSLAKPLASAFQAQNDVAGVRELWRHVQADEDTMLLANVSDIPRRRRTIIAKAALNRLKGAQRDRFLAFYQGAIDISANEVLELIVSCGALEYADELVGSLFDASCRAVTEADCWTSGAKEVLINVVLAFATDLYNPNSNISAIHLEGNPVDSSSSMPV